MADDITNNAQREITFKDLAKFVEARARALTHPVFGNISGDSKGSCKDLKGSKNQKNSNFEALPSGPVPKESGLGRPSFK